MTVRPTSPTGRAAHFDTYVGARQVGTEVPPSAGLGGLSHPGCPNLTMAGRQDRCGLFRSPPTCGAYCGEAGIAKGMAVRAVPAPVQGLGSLVAEVETLARGLAIPHVIDSHDPERVLVTTDPEVEGALFGWAQRIEEQRADLSVDSASGQRTVSGHATVLITRRPGR